MIFSLNFPLFLIVASLLSSVISNLLNHQWARRLTLVLTFSSVICNGILLNFLYNHNEIYYYLMGHFSHPWGNELRITLVEALMATIFSIVLFLTIWGGKEAIDEFALEEKRNIYYIMCDLVMASMIALVYTNDIFTGYVFVEILTLASAGILAIRDNGRSIVAALRYMIYALVGSGLFLFGIVFLYNITGHLLMPDLHDSIQILYESGTYKLPLVASLCLMVIGIAIKSGLFPFHFWMADTYGEAIPTSSGILSGVISKIYIFLLIKIIFDVYGTNIFYNLGINTVACILGASGIIIGSIGALHENNIFRMCAYSSAAQIGYIYLGIGISPTFGIIAALYQMMTHAFTKPPIFLSVYRISKVSGHAKQFKHLEGAANKDIFSAIAFTFEALSMIGVPLTMGFISKYLFASSVFENSHFMMVITILVLVISTILNTLYFTRTIIRIFNNHQISSIKTAARPPFVYFVSAILFMGINIFFGVCGGYLTNMIQIGLSLL